LFNALSSQLDLVGLHLLGSIVLEGLVGGVVSARVGVSVEAFSWSILVSNGVCVREAGKEGFANVSLAVDAVIQLFIELDVPGRS
jgi:hypothetical protein